MIFGVQLRREPQRAAHDRTPPETHVGGVLKSDMTTHVDLNKLLTVRTATFIYTVNAQTAFVSELSTSLFHKV